MWSETTVNSWFKQNYRKNTSHCEFPSKSLPTRTLNLKMQHVSTMEYIIKFLKRMKFCLLQQHERNTCLITFATFWWGCGNSLSLFWVSLSKLFWLPWCLELIWRFYPSWFFCLCRRATIRTVPDLVNKVNHDAS